MLTGPTGQNDYFNSDHHFPGSFPTPNESSLRSGLTPGGGGSMFPQPSPNSQALYNQLQNGGATPGTLDFHRTAMTARAQTSFNLSQNAGTSQPQQQNPNIQPDLDTKPFPQGVPNQQQQQNEQDPFSNHHTNDAANGLFMLAQAGNQRGAQQGSSMQQQQAPQGYPPMQQETNTARQNTNSIGSTMSGGTENGQGDYSDGSVDTKPQKRGKKGGSAGKAGNGKRKAEETPTSKMNNKKPRVSNGQAMPEDEDDMMDDEDMANDDDDTNPDGRKMTDEEKRKNFLERNRYVYPKSRFGALSTH